MMNKPLLWVILAVVLATGAFGLGRILTADPQHAPIVASSPLAGRPECPHDWDFKRGQMALVGQKINVPEFHDCQRFIVYERDSAKYQALYAIFAAAGLNALDTLATDSVRAAAEVFAEGRYEPLGIVATYSCLYLFRKSHDPASPWRAIMAPVADAQFDCRTRVNPDTMPGRKVLDVRRTPVPGFGGADYPPVARWDWDREHRKQYIGIKCGAAWCEVGGDGFTPGPGFSDPGGSQKVRRTHLIKGWYDQQFLATFSPTGKTTPSRIRGTIIPDSGLGDYDTLGVFRRVQPGQWIPVAQVLLEAPATLTAEDAAVIQQYKDSLNFEATAVGGAKFNTISLCHGKKNDCVPGQFASAMSPCDGDGMWWALIVSAYTNNRVYKCVARRAHDHLEFRVPGTTRWRWLASDETTWKRCDNGCCEVN